MNIYSTFKLHARIGMHTTCIARVPHLCDDYLCHMHTWSVGLYLQVLAAVETDACTSYLAEPSRHNTNVL